LGIVLAAAAKDGGPAVARSRQEVCQIETTFVSDPLVHLDDELLTLSLARDTDYSVDFDVTAIDVVSFAHLE
jgi:hypothetical protein